MRTKFWRGQGSRCGIGIVFLLGASRTLALNLRDLWEDRSIFEQLSTYPISQTCISSEGGTVTMAAQLPHSPTVSAIHVKSSYNSTKNNRPPKTPIHAPHVALSLSIHTTVRKLHDAVHVRRPPHQDLCRCRFDALGQCGGEHSAHSSPHEHPPIRIIAFTTDIPRVWIVSGDFPGYR